MMESDVRRIMASIPAYRLYFRSERYPWVPGLVVYTVGLVISATAGDLFRFVTDPPWACLSIAVTIASMSVRRVEIQGRATLAIRKCLDITDEEFGKLLEANIRRLGSMRNVVLGLAFLPALLWALTQRLWWGTYAQPSVFDIYYLALLAVILMTYANFMFGAAVSCNQNVYNICEKTPIDREYLLDEGLPILKKQWGGLILRVTVIALVMVTLTSVPILLYSGSVGLLVNLGMALTLTALIFVVPHFIFHRLLEREKDEGLFEISEKLKKLKSYEEPNEGDAPDMNSMRRMLDKINLTQRLEALRSRGTWLVDSATMVEVLAVVASSQEILNLLVHH